MPPVLRQTHDSMAADQAFYFHRKTRGYLFARSKYEDFTEIKMKMNSLSIPQLALFSCTKCLKHVHVSFLSATIGSYHFSPSIKYMIQ